MSQVRILSPRPFTRLTAGFFMRGNLQLAGVIERLEDTLCALFNDGDDLPAELSAPSAMDAPELAPNAQAHRCAQAHHHGR